MQGAKGLNLREVAHRARVNSSRPFLQEKLMTRPTNSFSAHERFLASLALLLSLVKIPGSGLFPVSAFLAVALLPMMLNRTSLDRRTAWLIGTSLVACLSGISLRVVVPSNLGHPAPFAPSTLIVGWLLAFPLIILMVQWATPRVGILWAMGLVLAGALGSTVLNGSTSWKGSLGLFVTLLALVLVAGRPIVLTRLVLAASAVLSVVTDARSQGLMAALAFVATLADRQTLSWIRRHPVQSLVLTGGLAYGAVALTLQGMLGGVFGEQIQSRTASQMRGGQSIIVGGRAEWAATVRLFVENPFGFGVGTVVNPGLQSEAMSSARSVGGDTVSAYYRTNVFGIRTDLHSQIADLWYHFGLPGLLFTLVLIVLLLTSVPYAIGLIRLVGAAPTLAIVMALWDILFSPMADSDRTIAGVAIAFAVTTAAVHYKSKTTTQTERATRDA